MNKNPFLLSASLVLILAFNGCGKLCQQANQEILVPVSEILNTLESSHSSDELLSNCLTTMRKIERVQAQSDVIRNLAETHLSNHHPGRNKTSRKTGYNTAINLAAHLDTLYAEILRMCRYAKEGHSTAALEDSRKIQIFISGSVIPEEDEVKTQACH